MASGCQDSEDGTLTVSGSLCDWLRKTLKEKLLRYGDETNKCIYSQTSVHERLGSRTVRFTNRFSEHKASRMMYRVSSYEHASRQHRGAISWRYQRRQCSEMKRRRKQITLDNILLRQRPSGSEAESSGAKRQKKGKESPSKQ